MLSLQSVQTNEASWKCGQKDWKILLSFFKSYIFCNTTLCSSLKVNRLFGRNICHLLQGRRNSMKRLARCYMTWYNLVTFLHSFQSVFFFYCLGVKVAAVRRQTQCPQPPLTDAGNSSRGTRRAAKGWRGLHCLMGAWGHLACWGQPQSSDTPLSSELYSRSW